MNTKMDRYVRRLREGLAGVVRLHPVEVLIALYGCVGCLMAYELDWNHAFEKLALAPLFFTAAFVVNNLAGRGPWRKLYWVVWAPMVPLTCWGGLEAWMASETAYITFGVLAPLSVLLCRLAVRNDRFVCDGIIYLRSGVLALFYANVALGLFYAILFSTTYIFGLEGRWIEHVAIYAVTLCETIGVPALLLMMTDRWQNAECRANRIVDVLLNYIVTPALMIYAAILYLYMVKILFTWTLPEGGVAYLVFGFTLFSLLVSALQFLLGKRIYDWFFDRISLVLLPAQILFWIGVLRRTSEYGLTEPRVYLLVCGALMTLCVLLFLSRRTGRYFYVCLAGLLCFAALAYVPSLAPERIAVRSQMERALRIARSLGRLDDAGRVLLTTVPAADTLYKREYRRLYESLDYVQRDTDAAARLGAGPDEFTESLPWQMRHYVKWGFGSGADERDSEQWWMLPDNAELPLDGTYSHGYINLQSWSRDGYMYENDTLRIWLGRETPVCTIPGRTLLQRQQEKSGFHLQAGENPSAEQLMQLLDYSDGRCRIIFGNIMTARTDSAFVIQNMDIRAVLLR